MNFIMTCSIAKPSGSVNALNEDSRTFGTPVAGIACMYSTKKHNGVNPASGDFVSALSETFYFPIGTDVRSGDQISALKFANGDSVTEKRFEVQPSPVERVSPTRGRLYVEAQVRSIE